MDQSAGVVRQSDRNVWRVASVPVSGVIRTIEPRSRGLVFPGQSFYGWQALPLKVCQPVSTGFPLPQPKSIRCGTIGPLH